MSKNDNGGIPINELPPGVLTVKCRQNDMRYAAASYAFQMAKAEAQFDPAVRRPVFVITGPEEFATSSFELVDDDSDLVPDDSADCDRTNGLAEHERYPVSIEASGLHFTMSTAEYLDGLVGTKVAPIIVIDGFDKFVTSDGSETNSRLAEWAQDHLALVVGVKWPRKARQRHAA